ncbi:TetR/AcrR family transcriptional regulator [Vineibacter terrae]|uniref:TetR/AcrR family transcriptional regulator n=1 Tax=Vineibacter terrae TaxID=2586908 RepID=UPI0015B38BFA|nr:TetR/AcrR family transcriptional regulator [Vineibacter terrae]
MKKAAWTEALQKRDEQYQLKRQALLQTAARAFNELGFDRASLDDLARRLNVTKPTLYYYIKSKDEILFECQKQAVEHMRLTLDQIRSSDKPALEKLSLFLVRYTELVAEDFGRCLVLSSHKALQPKNRAKMAAARRRLDNDVRNLIAQGIAEGSIAPCNPKLVTSALFGAVNWTAHWYSRDGELTPRAVGEAFLSTFLSGLVPRQAAQTVRKDQKQARGERALRV